jgi:tetratricopeptide (TPR) repeat protein
VVAATSARPGSPLLGREAEISQLDAALARAQEGRGSAWIVQGPAGMGKTRLLRWLEQRSQELGFTAVWGYALQDIPTPFFLMDQVFARLPTPSGPAAASSRTAGPLPPLLLLLADRAEPLYARAEDLPPTSRLLLVARDMPARIASKHPRLPRGTRTLWLTRAEGNDHLAPGDLDRLGEAVSHHFEEAPEGVVALGGIDYLVSQSGFTAVLHLVQYLRDVAESTGGHLVLGVAPGTLAPRELALLEAEGEVERLAPTEGKDVPAAPAEDEPASARLLRYASTLERLAAGRPVLLLVDDLQWADPQSLAAYRFLVRGLSGHRAMIAGTLREEGGAGVSAELLQGLDALDTSGSLNRMVLGPLDAGASERVALSALPGPIRGADATELSRLLARAGGNPYFLLETVRYLLKEGYLRGGPDACTLDARARGLLDDEVHPGAASGVPPALARLLRARLQPLPLADRELLETAGVAGSHFPESAVAGALGRPVEQVRRDLERLDREHFLVEPEGDGGGTWEFRHPYVWEVVAEATAPDRAASQSLAVARWWAEFRPHQVDAVARLYHKSGEAAEGLPWLAKASERAEKLHAGEALERYARWMLDLLGSSPEAAGPRREARLQLAEGLFYRGEGARALQELEGMVETERTEEGRLRVELHLCNQLKDIDPARADERIERLEATWPSRPGQLPVDLELDHAAMLADWHMLRGRPEKALEVARQGLQRFPASANATYVARLYDSVGWAAIKLHDFPEARSAFEAGRKVSEEAGLQGYLAYHLNGLGYVALEQNRFLEGVERLREALEVSLRAGDLVNAVVHAGPAAEYAIVLNGMEAGRPIIEQAMDLTERLDMGAVEDRVRGMLGNVAVVGGDMPLARRCLLADGRIPGLAPGASRLRRLFQTVELLLREGKVSEADRLWTALPVPELDPADPRPYSARLHAVPWVHLAKGRHAEAEAALSEAVAWVGSLDAPVGRSSHWLHLRATAQAIGPADRVKDIDERIAADRVAMGLPAVREPTSGPGKA